MRMDLSWGGSSGLKSDQRKEKGKRGLAGSRICRTQLRPLCSLRKMVTNLITLIPVINFVWSSSFICPFLSILIFILCQRRPIPEFYFTCMSFIVMHSKTHGVIVDFTGCNLCIYDFFLLSYAVTFHTNDPFFLNWLPRPINIMSLKQSLKMKTMGGFAAFVRTADSISLTW